MFNGDDMGKFIEEEFSIDNIVEVNSYNKNKNEKKFFSKKLTFPVEKKEQITRYMKKHYDELIDYIISNSETNY